MRLKQVQHDHGIVQTYTHRHYVFVQHLDRVILNIPIYSILTQVLCESELSVDRLR